MTNRMNKDLRNVEVMINSGFNGAGTNERIENMLRAVNMTKANRKNTFLQFTMMFR